MTRSNLSRRTLLQSGSGLTLAAFVQAGAQGGSRDADEGAGMPKICLELSGRLQAAAAG